jgi:hypothetical protein
MPILKEIFSTKNYHWRDTPISIDEQITNLVIKNRVMVDCNLVGGTHALIPLDNLRVEQVDAYTNVYRIPKSLTQGRSIVSVLSVGYGTTSLQGLVGGLGSIRPGSVSAAAQAGQAMMDSMSPIPVSSTAKVQLIAENTIMVRDTNTLISNGYLRCILANDNEFSHIQLRSILAFCKLVELAVKSYIYNEYTIQMDRAFLSGGQDLGRFKEIVDSYADAEEMYQDYLREKWAKTSFMNDTETYTRFLKMQLGSHR